MNLKEKIIRTTLLGIGIICVMFFYYKLNAVGHVNAISRRPIESTLFEVQEVEAAMDVVEQTFKQDYTGCTLIDFWYDEAFSDEYDENWAKQYEADEAIVLLSTFHVGTTWIDSTLEPDTTYPNWQWILVRNDDGPWELKTWGY